MKYFIILLFFVLVVENAWPVNTEVKGFIALDLLKIVKENKKETSFQTGIGVLDLKFYATHDDLSAKIKLDLDDSKIDEAYNIFEEANISWRISNYLKITAGKGLVPFHQKHFGVIESSYVDGGSVLGAENSWRDQDNKLLTIISIGNYNMNVINHMTFYGDSKQVEKDEFNQPKIDPIKDEITYTRAQKFRTDNERGFADKIQIFMGPYSIYTSGIYYFNDIHPKESWAVDIGGNYKKDKFEIWTEAMYGFHSTHPKAKYASCKQYEKFFQLGGELYLTHLINLLTNFEFILVTDNTWTGPQNKDNNFKLAVGTKFKVRKNGFFVVGILGEKKHRWINNQSLDSKKAMEIAAKFSFWF